MNHSSKNTISAMLISLFLFQNTLIAHAKKENNDNASFKKIEFQKINSGKNFKEGEVIVKFKKDRINLEKSSGKIKVKSFENNKGLEEIDSANNLNAKLLKSKKKTLDLIDELKNDPNVEYVEANIIRNPLSVPNDTYFNLQWPLDNTGQTFTSSTGASISGAVDSDIDALETWNIENSSNQEVTVAIIDTGARFTHEDLTVNMWDGTNCKDENNQAVSGGCPNHGWDYKDGDSNPDDSIFPYCYEYAPDQITCLDEQDVSGHGTFISGIIGGVHNNLKGISGISSKNKIKIMPIRFDLDTFSEIQAINFAKNNGAKVINASFGGTEFSQLEKDAIESFPGIFVAAAGNESTNNETLHFYPSDYASSNIISVAATDQNDVLATFSNYGSLSVDLAAPGKNVTSTFNNSDTQYAVGDGTSFAAPYIAAASALLYSANISLSSSALKDIILASGDSLPTLSGKTVSGKRLNLNNAYQLAIKIATPTALPAGGTYASTQSVTLSSSTTGADIFYTLDGSQPSISSTKYTIPISVTDTATLKSIAVKDGMTDSEIFSSSYIINIPQIVTLPDPIETAKAADFDLYQKYDGYLKYEKGQKYKKYEKAKEKYGFKNSAEKSKYKQAYNNFKLFKKNPVKYPKFALLIKEYKKYKKYQEQLAPLSKYSKYSNYSKKEYSNYKYFGSNEYEAGHERYLTY